MNTPIFDAHAYIGSDYHTYFQQIGEYTIDRYQKVMEECGIAKAVLIPGGYNEEIGRNYEEIQRIVRGNPEKYVGFVRPNPRDPKVLDYVEKALTQDGMKGIMLHPHWDVFLANSKLVFPIFELAQSRKVPILVYSGDIPYSMPAQIADMAVKFPDVPVIMGHMAKTEIYQHVVASAMRSPNIYVETSGCNVSGILEDAVDKLGAERVLFGTGWPGMSPHAEIVKFKRLNLTDEERECIFWKNMNNILDQIKFQ